MQRTRNDSLQNEWPVAVLLVALTVVVAHPLLADDEQNADPTQSKRIVELIEQLGSPSFEDREAATTELVRLGKSARADLLDARGHKSPEVRSRVTRLLKQFHVPLRDLFQALARQPDDKLDLEEGMWLIARILNPDVQRETLNKQLDDLAAKVRQKLGKDVAARTAAPELVVSAIRQVLFEDEKFAGNQFDYQNPANSSLEKVLETRMGLPILLSHLVVCVADRLEVPIVGIPTPGRYIVKYDGQRAPMGFAKTDIYLDPYYKFVTLTRDDRMREFPGLDPDQMVPPSSKRNVLIRMLNNIETHLFGRDEVEQAYLAVEFRNALELAMPNAER